MEHDAERLVHWWKSSGEPRMQYQSETCFCLSTMLFLWFLPIFSLFWLTLWFILHNSVCFVLKLFPDQNSKLINLCISMYKYYLVPRLFSSMTWDPIQKYIWLLSDNYKDLQNTPWKLFIGKNFLSGVNFQLSFHPEWKFSFQTDNP